MLKDWHNSQYERNRGGDQGSRVRSVDHRQTEPSQTAKDLIALPNDLHPAAPSLVDGRDLGVEKIAS
jgi:hypothetical protein